MIIDTSAAVALLRAEPESERFLAALESTAIARMSAASVLELSIVTTASGPGVVDEFLAAFAVQVLPIDLEQLRWARHAHEQYGRGSGSPARLNFGDCFAYAAAKATDETLLFKGADFGHTDVRQLDC